jgi:flavin reductase (DIM6/NTAB) family NADH-FMN oxidoreductase RutF
MDVKMLSFDTNGDFASNYKFLIGAIIPRPIASVSTVNKDGTNNLAPFSFFNGVCPKPMIVAFSPVIRTSTGEKKDTLLNIEREKEFVINFTTEDIAEKINNASAELAYGEDEFEFAGLTPVDSEIVKAKRILESPIQFECKLRDLLEYGTEPGAGTLVTGEVVKIHVREDLYESGRINTDLFKPIGRGAGNDWIKTNNRVQFERKMQAQIQK